MNIAVVGEGPIGAIVCLFFIYYKLTFNISDLNIFFYKSRSTFKRRHIVQMNKNVLEKIEQLIYSCADCLTMRNPKQIISLSIRCLEFLLHKNIINTHVNIIEQKFTQHENIENTYQHIFLCDGFSSTNRSFYIYDDQSYKPLQMIFNEPILILYGNLDLSDADITNKCVDSFVIKKQYTSDDLREYKIELNTIVSFISIIYNINDGYDKFEKIAPNKNMNKINLWIEGYTNYENFLEIFNYTIEYVIDVLKNTDILSIFYKKGVVVSKTLSDILDKKFDLLPTIFQVYKYFVKQELNKINGLMNPFIIHSVMPSCKTFGIILDDNVESLVFAKTKEPMGYTSWLIGDSANSYPPNASLNNGIKDVFALIPNFIQTNFLPELVIPFLNNKIFECDESSYVFNKPQICNALSSFYFSGGYLLHEITNNAQEININLLITKIQTKKCSDNGLVNMYNNYQLNMFFANLIKYVCKNDTLDPTSKFGGKIKNKIIRKYKSIKTKNKKYNKTIKKRLSKLHNSVKNKNKK